MYEFYCQFYAVKFNVWVIVICVFEYVTDVSEDRDTKMVRRLA